MEPYQKKFIKKFIKKTY